MSIASLKERLFVTLPKFLRGLEDSNLQLLTDLSERPVRLVAIEVVCPGPQVPCRILDLNVESFTDGQNAEEYLRDGLYPDDIFFNADTLALEGEVGEPERKFRIELKLAAGDKGRYCDCTLPPFLDSAPIKAAVDELEAGGSLEWYGLF